MKVIESAGGGAPAAKQHPRDLDRGSNLFDFFHAHVDQALQEQGKPVSEEGAWYLTSLLVERAHPDSSAPEEAVDTLAELRIRAATGDRSGAIRAYRSLGDRALVVSGFFRESLSRKLVSRQYYLDMGASAYDALAGLLRAAGFGGASVVGDAGPARGLDDIYHELAHAFGACAEVLGQVREAVRHDLEGEEEALSDGDILSMYEEWLAPGSPRIAARLARLGVAPVRASDGRVC